MDIIQLFNRELRFKPIFSKKEEKGLNQSFAT